MHAQAFKAFEEGNFKKAVGLWKKGIKKCKKINDMQLLAKLHLGAGMGYAQDREYANALINFQHALDLYKKANNTLKQAHSLYFIGKMYLKLKNFDLAIKNYNAALKIAQNIKDKELQADILFDIGVLYSVQDQLNKSMNIFRQVLKMYKKIEKIVEQGEVHFEMGKVLRDLGEEHYQDALKNFRNALKIMIKENRQKNVVDCRNQMGDLLLLLKQPQEALNQYQKAMKKSRANKDVIGEITANFGKGKALFDLERLTEAIKIFNSTIEFYQKIQYLKGEISCLTYLSNSYEKLKNPDKAKKFKKLAQEKSKKLEKKEKS